MENKKIRVGITQGDINGVSYEVILKTFGAQSKMVDLCTPVLYGSQKLISYYRNALNVKHLNTNTIESGATLNPQQLNIVNCVEGEIKVDIGQSTVHAGDCAIKALDKAIEDKKADHYDVMVTAPLNKENVQKCLPNFSGHTEYLQEKFESGDVLMMMVKDKLRVAVATTHIPVNQVASAITPELIEKKVKLLSKSLLEDFTIRKGRIAVLGLNPHCGDNGAIGTEDSSIVTPTLENLRAQGMNAFGPFPADGFFGSGEYKKYDAILAMYHDQGLVPFKVLAEGGGVNYTAGLPIVRTSPAHGTAYGITGQGKANPDSFRDAIYLGIDIFRNRQIYNDASANPLVIQEPRSNNRHRNKN